MTERASSSSYFRDSIPSPAKNPLTNDTHWQYEGGMAKVDNRLNVNLENISEHGEAFTFVSPDKSLDPILQDLVRGHAYEIRLQIKPVGNAFAISGKIVTKMPLVCSRCALDFNHPVDLTVNELLLIEGALNRTERSRHQNHLSDSNSQAFCNYLVSPIFDIGEFIHEQVAAAEPAIPLAMEQCETDCPNLERARREGWLKFENQQVKNSPFEVLKNLTAKND